MSRTLRRLGVTAALLVITVLSARGQSVSDAIDDPIDCATGKAVAGLLPGVVDIISIDIRKQNEDLVATIEFRGDPSIGDSVSGGILAFDPEAYEPGGNSQWHFDNAGNAMFVYAGDAVSTGTEKTIVDSLGVWVADTTTSFTATRAGNVVIVRIPGSELKPGSTWMAFSSSVLFELSPRCDAAGNDKNGLPALDVPQLVAMADTFRAAGNVRITVPETDGLLANDIDALSIIDADDTSVKGGSVLVETSGAFSFDPKPGFSGTDSFSYTVTDGKGGTAAADVSIAVGPALWFINAAAPGPGTGTWSDPFPDVTSFSLLSGEPSGPHPSDAILIFGGTEYDSNLRLDSNQVLIGQGVDMLGVAEAEGFLIPPYSDILDDPPVSGAAPILRSDSTNAIEVGIDNKIFGVSIGDTPHGSAIKGDSVSSLFVSDVSIFGKGGLLDLAGGQIDVKLDSALSDGAAEDAVNLVEINGTLSVTGPTVIVSPKRDGLRASGGALEIELDAFEVTDADSGSAINIWDIPAGSITIGSVIIVSNSGRGIGVETGGELLVGGGVVSTGGTALDLEDVNVDLVLDTLRSSGESGIRLVGVLGSLSIPGSTRIDSTTSHGLRVEDSAVSLNISDLHIGRADSAYGVYIVNSPESDLEIDQLDVSNAGGGGLLAHNLNSIRISAGAIVTKGGRAVDLSDLIADVSLDFVTADSVDSGVALNNIGGTFQITADTESGSGSVTRAAGTAVDVTNVSQFLLNRFNVSQVGAHAIYLKNFGEAVVSNINIQMADSAGIKAAEGGAIQISGNSVSSVRTGIEVYEVGEVSLIGNDIKDTDTTAVIVTNAFTEPAASKGAVTHDSDSNVEVRQNEVLTGATEGISISAVGTGTVSLQLTENQSTSSTNDYVFVVDDSATLMLDGFAGGEAEDLIAYVRNVNVGFPRVLVRGQVAAGPSGEADVAALEMTVSDSEPLPERLIEYRMTLTNRGPSPALAVTLVDSLPDGIAYVPETLTVNGVLQTDDADEDAGEFDVSEGGTATFRLGDLSVADTVVVTFGARPRQANAGSSVRNAARISTSSPDSVASNNSINADIAIKLNTAMENDEIPRAFALRQNYPNPFNPVTTIGLEIPVREFIRLTVFNVLGQPVATLVESELDAGRYDIRWDARAGGRPASSGTYFYRLEAGAFAATRRMTLVK